MLQLNLGKLVELGLYVFLVLYYKNNYYYYNKKIKIFYSSLLKDYKILSEGRDIPFF